MEWYDSGLIYHQRGAEVQVLNIKTSGRDANCDLVLEHSTISRRHARIELRGDGRVFVQDTGSKHGIFLHRNEQWIRIKRVSLCVGDSIRFGDYTVPLERLISVFGQGAKPTLGARHFSLRQANNPATDFNHPGMTESKLQQPKRNPLTGKIEERSP